MGWPVPRMAHIPLIHGEDGGKLSKRHGALGAEAYRAMGYLPDALCNYLARLGWSHGDDEVMSMNQMIEWFDIADVNKGAARFDLKKLEALNGHYIRNGDDEKLADALAALFPEMEDGSFFSERFNDDVRSKLIAAMPALKNGRARFLNSPMALGSFSISDRSKTRTRPRKSCRTEAATFLLGSFRTWNQRLIGKPNPWKRSFGVMRKQPTSSWARCSHLYEQR